MALFRVEGLPADPLAAAADFHARILPALPQDDPCLTLVFTPANHDHHGWRLAVTQSLAREWAPRRVNAIASGSAAAIAAAQAYLDVALGVTGQYLLLDDAGVSL